MNFETVKGNFKDWKNDMEAKWCNLTDEDWKEVEGSRDKLVAKIQERYGRSREEARREVDDFWIEHVILSQNQDQQAQSSVWIQGHGRARSESFTRVSTEQYRDPQLPVRKAG